MRKDYKYMMSTTKLLKKIHSQDKVAFILEWAKSPLKTASVVPSSPALAHRMARSIRRSDKPVIELGPGTGVFTEAMISAGIPESQLTLVEVNKNFAKRLSEKYPQATVIEGMAEDLAGLPESHFGSVVSGLPFLSMKSTQVDGILSRAFQLLDDEGVFIQFTYGPKCPVSTSTLKHQKLVSRRSGFALKNFPPASVFTLAKQNEVVMATG